MRILRLLPLLVAAIGCGKGQDLTTHEGVADAEIKAMEDFADVFDGITDKASAEAALPKIEAVMARMKEVEAARRKLGDPGPEERQRLDARLATARRDVDPRMQKNMERLQGVPDALTVLVPVMIRLAGTTEGR
jgi:hypothetical protein